MTDTANQGQQDTEGMDDFAALPQPCWASHGVITPSPVSVTGNCRTFALGSASRRRVALWLHWVTIWARRIFSGWIILLLCPCIGCWQPIQGNTAFNVSRQPRRSITGSRLAASMFRRNSMTRSCTQHSRRRAASSTSCRKSNRSRKFSSTPKARNVHKHTELSGRPDVLRTTSHLRYNLQMLSASRAGWPYQRSVWYIGKIPWCRR